MARAPRSFKSPLLLYLKCDKGHKGRIGIYEMLVASPDVRHLIRSHATVPQLVDAAAAGGMHLLKQDALVKVLRGLIDLQSARAAAS